MKKKTNIEVRGIAISMFKEQDADFISLTNMLKAKDGDFFISDWLRNRNTIEFLGIWETINNQNFNYGEFAIIKTQAGLNSYAITFILLLSRLPSTWKPVYRKIQLQYLYQLIILQISQARFVFFNCLLLR